MSDTYRNIVIGLGAASSLSTESDILAVGKDAQTPAGRSGWVNIKGVYEGPMRAGYGADWQRIVEQCEVAGHAFGRPEYWPKVAAAIAGSVAVIPRGVAVTADQIRDAVFLAAQDLHGTPNPPAQE